MIVLWLNPFDNRAHDFWSRFITGHPGAARDVPDTLHRTDVVVHDLRLGIPPHPSQTIGLLWSYDHLLENPNPEAIARITMGVKTCARVIAPDTAMGSLYQRLRPIDIIPLGVDTNTFHPQHDRAGLRDLYGLPQARQVGFWCGTLEGYRGYNRLLRYAQNHPGTHWVLIFKNLCDPIKFPYRRTIFYDIGATTMADLMTCSDFGLSTTLFNSLTTTEHEGIACELPWRSINDSAKFNEAPNNDMAIQRWNNYAKEFTIWLSQK